MSYIPNFSRNRAARRNLGSIARSTIKNSAAVDISKITVERSPSEYFKAESSNTNQVTKDIHIGTLTLEKATKFIQEHFAEQKSWNDAELQTRTTLIAGAMAGDYDAADSLCKMIAEKLDYFGVSVDGMTTQNVAYEIYKYAWGLDVLEDTWRDPEINELRINGPHDVRCQRLGRNLPTDIKFKDEAHVKKIIDRSCLHDRVGLNRHKAAIEYVRKDGSRITATYPPVTPCTTAVFRKHDLSMQINDMIKLGTLSESVSKILSLLVRGRASVIITGGCDTGKTTILRCLLSYYHPTLRIVTIESNYEIYAHLMYPDRDITALCQVPGTEYTMQKLFTIILRISPDVVITGEIRGEGEANGAIKSATRGMDGSIATAHFNSAEEVPSGVAKMLIEEGLNLPYELAFMNVAEAFNINIHMHADPTVGKKILTSITEYVPDRSQNNISYNRLVEWTPEGDDYFKGEWNIINRPSKQLLQKLVKYGVTTAELRELGWA